MLLCLLWKRPLEGRNTMGPRRVRSGECVTHQKGGLQVKGKAVFMPLFIVTKEGTKGNESICFLIKLRKPHCKTQYVKQGKDGNITPLQPREKFKVTHVPYRRS